MKCFKIVIVLSSILIFGHHSAIAKDLIEVIPSLYGGDGVQLVTATSGFSHAPHFQDDALQELNSLTQAASDFDFPYPSVSGGISFNYDPILDDFVRTLEDNTLLYTDPAKTLGKGRVSGGIVYSNISFDKLNGRRLSKFSLSLDHEDLRNPGSDICIGGPMPSCYLFENDDVILDVDLELNSDVLFFYAGFGLTDNIDFEFILPVIKNRLAIFSNARVLEDETKQFFAGTLHQFDETGNNGDVSRVHAKENKIGFGDLELHSKWNFYSSKKIQLATLVELLIPTGDQDNFMGSDSLSITPILILSTLSGVANIPVNVHLNLGYEFSTGDRQNELSYAAAIEYRQQLKSSVISTAFEILGKHVIETRSGFGDDQIDAAVGAKLSFLESHSLFFNYRFPLNDDGLRASNIFSVGYAANF